MDYMVCRCFSHPTVSTWHLVDYFLMKDIFLSDNLIGLFFAFVICILGISSKNFIARTASRLSPFHSSSGCAVSGLMFKFLIHFEVMIMWCEMGFHFYSSALVCLVPGNLCKTSEL